MSTVARVIEVAHESPVAEWAPVAAAFFAFLAAGASWANVRQTRREWRASLLPYLHGQATHDRAAGRINFGITNSGKGIARGVGFCLVLGDSYVAGYATDDTGLLGPDQRLVVETELPEDGGPDAQGVVTCQDATGVCHIWNLVGEDKVWRTNILRRKKASPSGEEALRAFYPERRLNELRQVGGRVRKP